jgi:hypothetical protein
MTWFKENKFLAGLLIVTVLGVGVLGYLLFASKSKYDESASAFEQQAAEFHRLESLQAYPDKANLETLEAQRVAHLGLIEDLQKSLAGAQMPMESITPNGFQDQVRVAVTQFTAKAGALSPPTELVKGFYLGFGPYQSAPPSNDAASPLARELKVVQMIGNILLDHHVLAISRFDREALPEEAGKGRPVETAKAPAKPGGKPAAAPLLKSHALDIVFVAEQKEVQGILNALVTNKTQFLIPRYVSVQNTNEHAPPKVPPEPPADPTTPPAPPDTTKPAKSQMLFGEEKVQVTLHLEIVDFNKPTPPAGGAAKVNRNAAK